MKITRLQAENFKKLRAISIVPGEDDAIVPIRGRNAAGKSSVLDAIQAALGGKSVSPKQPIRKGEEDSAIRLELDGGALVVRRTFTAEGGGQIIVESADGARYPSPQKMLDSLYASVAFDPLAFTRLEPEQQFEQLRRLVKLDIDIDALAKANTADYEERTAVNRELKQLRGQLAGMRNVVLPNLPAEPIDESAIVKRMQEAGEANALLERRKANREQFREAIERNRQGAQRERDTIATLEERLTQHRANLAQFEAQIEKDEATLANAEPLSDPIDTSTVAAELDDARRLNANLQEVRARKLLEEQIAAKEKASEALTTAMDARNKERADAIGRADMPVPGLSMGAATVLFNDIPLEQASSAEQLRVSTAIGMAGNPKLRVMLVRDGSLLDEDGEKILAQMAATNDFQLWLETVDTSGKVGIVMEDGAVKDAPEPEPIGVKRRKKSESAGEGEAQTEPVEIASGQGEDAEPSASASPAPSERLIAEAVAAKRTAETSLFD